MDRTIERRQILLGGMAWVAGSSFGLNFATPIAARARPFGRNQGAFETILRASTGAVAAGFSDFAVQSPEGSTCKARLAYPLVLNKKLPVLIFCPDEGATAAQYDQITGALASQDFFVLTIDRRPLSAQASRTFFNPEQQAEYRLRRFAEARFLLDTIDAAAAVLGPKADLIETARIGAMGHGDGAWIAAGLGGWDSSGGASTRTRDGRVHAVIGLLPSRATSPSSVPAQRSPDGVSGMFIGDLAIMPAPQRGSGLLGLGLPVRSASFGGLIGSPSAAEVRRLNAEPQALAAAIASSVLFFDWTLRGSGDRKKELMALDGRHVEGLQVPLQLRKA
jgi:hypothetical protein